MDEWESVAKSVVESVVDGARMEYREADRQHGDGLPRHDFWLHRPGKSKAAVEVTSVQDEDRTRTEEKLRRERFQFEAVKCNWTWTVHVRVDTRVRELKNRLDELLAALESEGAHELTDRPTPPRQGPAAELYEELSVQTARAHPEATPPTIHVHPGGTGGYVHAGVVTEVVESLPSDNWEKLGEVDVQGRHLFVVLTTWAPGASSIQMTEPDGRPELQGAVTHLWAAARRFDDPESAAVWRASRTEPWESVGPVDLG